jgi:hypothetical protein
MRQLRWWRLGRFCYKGCISGVDDHIRRHYPCAEWVGDPGAAQICGVLDCCLPAREPLRLPEKSMSAKHAETAAKMARKLIERRRELVLEVGSDPRDLDAMEELYQLQETIDLLRRISEDERGVFRLTELAKEPAQDNNRNSVPRDAKT